MTDPVLDYVKSSQHTQPRGQSPVAKRPLIRASDIRELASPLERLIGDYPAVALASAFLAGVALAWWIKRK